MKCRKQVLSIFAAAVTALALSVCAWGQATTSLHGTVADPSGAAIPQAKLTLTNVATNTVRNTTSNSTGAYDFVSVLPGTYTLNVEAKGFRTFVQKGLVLQVSLPATLNVALKVGSVSETMEVTGTAPLLNTTDSSVGHTMGTSAIESLPLQAEQMPLLLSFQPGVVYNGDNILTSSYDTRAGSVNGERSDQNNITLDGVSDNNEFTGYAFTGVLPTTQFSVQEFRVTTSNYDATSGRSAGAQITMVTKGGTNQFHGSLYDFNRNTIGEANDYFVKNAQIANGDSNVPGKLVRNIFGGTIGGPIKKNRLFFFFNYEGHRISQASGASRTIPSAALRDGIIQYACADQASCPGGSVTGLSGTSYTVAPGYYALSSTQLAQMDPLGIGPSQVALNYFKTYPLPNATGGDNLNYGGYVFAAPAKTSANWYIGRLDYNLTQNGNHTLFLRGAIRDDRATGAPFLPGTSPMTNNVDLSKGLVAGYTGVLSSRIVNSFRYGLTRQSLGTVGDSNQPWIIMRGMDQDITRSSGSVSPVHNFIDTLSWQKGSHNFQFGANIALIRRHSYTYSNFSDALLNSDWLDSGGFAGQASQLNPAYGCDPQNSGPCYPAVSSGWTNAYDFPLAAMMGIASEVDAVYNYHVDNATTASPIAQGSPIVRNWATDTYNLFAQDTWHALPNLTVTYGLNYQLMTPITETAGQEVEPNVNMGAWFNQRWSNMLQGVGANQDPVISFAPAGSVYGTTGMYNVQSKNFAPRVGIAWTPNPKWDWLKKLTGENKTVVRAGFGMYYDNFGPELALQYDASGSFGLRTVLQNPASTLSLADAPRITSMNDIPTVDNSGNAIMEPAPPSTFPATYTGVEAIAHGIDQSIKTPYSYALNLSIQRELPGKMMLDVGYVGHFAHRLLALDDIATPADLVDPKSGIDYFAAASRLSELARNGTASSAITADLIGPTAQYWQDMIAPQASYLLWSTRNSTKTLTPNMLAAVYDMFKSSLYNETSALYHLDLSRYSAAYGPLPVPITGANSFYNSQYSSLWVWRSMAHSNYNALELGLHKDMSHGVLFGFNYTYSKSMDIESMSERGAHFLTDSVINGWDPNQMYAPSDFDLRHQINAYWVANLPFGRGKTFGSSISNWADALVGGWQLSGTTRWTSGFPGSVYMSYVWPTNWDEMGWANLVSPVKTGTTFTNGIPNVFQDATQAKNSFDFAYPGQSGSRNNIRGNGFFGVDMSLAKSWKMPHLENQSLQFRWNVYNVTNSARFDIQSVNDQVAGGSTFGNYSKTLTNPRVMEFSLIYSF